jgi:hypothetical protein
MGCLESRRENLEENHLIACQKDLGYSKKSVFLVESTLKQYSTNGYLSYGHLQSFAKSLDIPIQNSQKNNRIEAFYNSIRSREFGYSLRDLLVIGLLLSNGKVSDKLSVLYEIYDENLQNELSLSDIKQVMLPNLIHHSVYSISLLVQDHKLSYMSLAKLKKYIKDLSSITSEAIVKISSLFEPNDLVSRKTFMETLSAIPNTNLTTAEGWRKYMLDTAKNLF